MLLLRSKHRQGAGTQAACIIVQVITAEGDIAMTLTLDALKEKYSKHSVTATLQCAGNRRAEMHAAREVNGLQWTNGAISTATWSGARLSDVLRDIGAKAGPDAAHVEFVGLDCGASGARVLPVPQFLEILLEASYTAQ
jgi:DMSO/TMAO reductase YedYZ molybdopterin-dependent catalytic subunit